MKTSELMIGDWVIIDNINNPCQIISINDNGNYIVQYCDDENTHILSKKFCESHFHIWTIQDAKPGDVLNSNGAPFIYKKHDENYVYYYCGINLADKFIIAYDSIEPWDNNSKVYPATKEQRDLLFKKMEEAGYEWDADEKKIYFK